MPSATSATRYETNALPVTSSRNAISISGSPLRIIRRAEGRKRCTMTSCANRPDDRQRDEPNARVLHRLLRAERERVLQKEGEGDHRGGAHGLQRGGDEQER